MMKLLVLLVIANFCAADLAKDFPYASGGTETNWGAFPAAVVVDGPNMFCGGTIIHPAHILTAASCVLNENYEVINPSWFSVFGGDIFFSPASARRQTRGVAQIFVHRQFNPFTGENNVALLRLNGGFSFPSNTLEISQRANRITPVGQACSLAAFGQATAAGQFRPRQVMINQPILNRDNCAMVNTTNPNRISESMLCAQSVRNNAPCNGNLGSGLYCNGLFTGILTDGLTCDAGIAVYQQVRAFNNWIVATMGLQEGNVAGSVPIETRGFPVHLRN